MSTLPFSQLQTFLAVARLNNFSAAARELGVSRAAVSQAVRQLEEQLRVTLVARTTRSVSLTDPGRRLVEAAGPALAQAAASLAAVSARVGEAVGKLRLSVPRAAVPFIIDPVLPTFRGRHPRVEVEIVVEDRLVDIVAGGFDAGIRLTEIIERDMVQVRLTDPFRFLIVGTPDYFAEHGTPQKPADLLTHECITFRSPTNGSLYAWELERGRKTYRVPVRGGVRTSSAARCSAFSKPIRRASLVISFISPATPSAPRRCASSSTPQRNACAEFHGDQVKGRLRTAEWSVHERRGSPNPMHHGRVERNPAPRR